MNQELLNVQAGFRRGRGTNEEELESLSMKVNEKAGLTLNIQKTKIMASSPITHGK